MKSQIVSLFILLCLIATSALADDKKMLADYFRSLKSFSAEFEQTVEKAQMAMTEVSRGKLVIEKPGKFRWDYVLPYEQQIVSNGKKVWIYDVDLEQVTIKPVDAALGNTPAMLLSSEEDLEKSFVIGDANDVEGVHWLSLKPKDAEAGFTEILLGFKQKELSQMMLVDNLGQITRLQFNRLKRNPKISDDTFEFVIPKGADVFDTTK